MKRKFYSAMQVARLLKVKPHVLRYWETEFDIRPERNSAGRRIYSQAQVDKLSQVKFLRYREQLTVRGARRKIEHLTHITAGRRLDRERRDLLLWLKQELLALRDLLSD